MESKEEIEELLVDNNMEQQVPTNNKENKHKSKKKLIVSIISIIAVIIIAIGIYTAYISNPKRIMAAAIDKVSSNFKDIIDLDEKNKIGENYTLKENIKLDIESDYLSALGTYSIEYQPYINLINNLSKLDTNITITQNKEAKQLFASLSSSLNNEELINVKYLIKNNTGYYFIKDFLSTYINHGSNNYFESLDESTTNSENIEYI